MVHPFCILIRSFIEERFSSTEPMASVTIGNTRGNEDALPGGGVQATYLQNRPISING